MGDINSTPLDISDIQQVLSDEEKEYLVKILSEYSSEGSSGTLESIYYEDYDEIPVDIRTFITDDRFLGKSFKSDKGELLVYPFWMDVLEAIFSPNSGIYETVFSGAIGIGKSTIACIGLAYILHRLLCLKNPQSYYRLGNTRIAIALFNINLDQGYGVGYTKLQSLLKASPWFLEHGSLVGIKNITYYPNKGIDILVGSKMEHFLGRDVFAAFLDEMNFAQGSSDPQMESTKIMKLYNTVKRRMESRYQKLGKLPGMLFLVSSKKSESDFLEQYIQKQKNKPYLYLVDEPIWVVKRGQGLYSGKTFNVAIGNRYLKSKVLEPDEDPKGYIKNGQEVIEVPIEYSEAFELDINTALMDIAGKALSANLKYIYYDKLKLCYRDYLKNPFTKNEIILGFDDATELKDFLIEKYLSKLDRHKPHFLHWDASKNGDATGLAMTTIADTKVIRRLAGGKVFTDEDIVHKLVFAIRIKNSPGQEIPFYKIRNFIYYLRFELGYNLISTTCDSFQSVDSLQQLKLHGFLAATLSMDRSRAPYDSLKNAINEGRYIMPYIPELEAELLDIEDNKVTGKIDHTAVGSKDIADACAGSLFRSIDYKKLLEEFNKGEDSKVLLEVNNTNNSQSGNWLLDSGRQVYD